jgi:phage host-nuclease inhibitor protein Gam
MANFKAVILKHQVREDGTYGIKIRLIHNRKSKYINTNLVVTKDEITKSFKLKNHFLIDETEKIIKKYRNICNKNASALDSMSIEQVFDLVTKSDKFNSFSIDIVEYCRNHIDILTKNGKNKTATIYKTALNSLIKFVGK